MHLQQPFIATSGDFELGDMCNATRAENTAQDALRGFGEGAVFGLSAQAFQPLLMSNVWRGQIDRDSR